MFWRAGHEAGIPQLQGWVSHHPSSQAQPPLPHPLPKESVLRGSMCLLSQLYCVTTRLPPRCKTLQLPNMILKVGDWGEGSGEGRGRQTRCLAAWSLQLLHTPQRNARRGLGKFTLPTSSWSTRKRNQTASTAARQTSTAP